MACRVGQGNTISVFNEPWLPDTNDPYIHTSSAQVGNVNVSSLMSMSENDWDRDIVMDIFEERDAHLILSIPVNKNEDTWYWKFDKLGLYSVKSAYDSIQDEKFGPVSADNSGFWRQLWNLKIPPKVKHFLWRAVTGSLPTKDNLRCKQVQISSCCPVCQNYAESTLHILVTCSFAEVCWLNSDTPYVTGEFHTFGDWLQLVFQQCSKMEVQSKVMICWTLWKNRNDLVWNQHSLRLKEVVELAKSVLNQWKCV